MPSPFPGMDPFLEDPAIFPDLHDRFVFCLSEALNAILPVPYFSGIASRVWIESSSRHIGPDVKVLRPTPTTKGGYVSASGGGVAVAEAVATEPIIVHVSRQQMRQTFLEIYADPGGERLVTSIELLSPSNKTLGDANREKYLQKQREILDSQANLVEIDLLRNGSHTTAIPEDRAKAEAGELDYHVSVFRYYRDEDFWLYAMPLDKPLRRIAVPLLPDAKPVVVDLQAVLDRCYDSGQYPRRVCYANPVPQPPLRRDQMEWVQRVLRDKGFVPSTPSATSA